MDIYKIRKAGFNYYSINVGRLKSDGFNLMAMLPQSVNGKIGIAFRFGTCTNNEMKFLTTQLL